ncbi:MAG: ComF family protein [Chitinispirillaceae bacterium]
MSPPNLRWVRNSFSDLLKRVGDFLVPQLCVVCDSPLSDLWFCSHCLETLESNHASRDACLFCSQNRKVKECTCGIVWDYPFERVFSFYDFDDLLRSVAHQIKYKGKRKLAFHIGLISAPRLPQGYVENADLIIPVPLHRSRMRQRGYNQAEWFARGVACGANSGWKVETELLSRRKKTATQTKLDKESRVKNLQKAFGVDRRKVHRLKDRSVLLVDDVLTTGATVEACTKELLKAGCAKVRVLSLGRD